MKNNAIPKGELLGRPFDTGEPVSLAAYFERRERRAAQARLRRARAARQRALVAWLFDPNETATMPETPKV